MCNHLLITLLHASYLLNHLHTTAGLDKITHTPNNIHTNLNMPVPIPSNTNTPQSQTSTATAETAHQVHHSSNQSVASASHAQKTQQELKNERLYEERMEEEYAKREGGA